MSRSVRSLALVLLAVAPGALLAQGAELGRREFANSCAQCHGLDGDGNGVMVGYLNTRPPPLTTLQKDNGGVFPVATLYRVIEGTAAAGAHGTSEMPAWGERYDATAPAQLGEMFSPADREAFTRGRLLALIEHISTLQEQ